jgi:hypothetical protein
MGISDFLFSEGFGVNQRFPLAVAAILIPLLLLLPYTLIIIIIKKEPTQDSPLLHHF